MNNEQTLLAHARQSTKDEQKARRKLQLEKVHQFWEDELPLLDDYTREVFADSYIVATGKVSDSSTALENVRRNLRRCQAQTREGFIRWALKQLAKEKGFHLVADAVKRFDLDISDWIDDAALRLSRYVNFPEHYKDGDLYRVKMGGSDGAPIVWTVPEQHWDFVRRLWPVTLKQRASGSYFIAKQVAGQTIPVHRLILPVTAGDTVQSTSGNFLDYSSLYVKPLNQSKLYDGRNTSWNKDANRPNTAQEEFEHRFQSDKSLDNYGTNLDCTERFSIPPPIPINANLEKTTCFGKVGRVGWVKPITPAERNYYAPELPSIPVVQSARRLAVEQALDRLGL